MYCVVHQGVAVETAQAGHGVVGVVTDATAIKQEIKNNLDLDSHPFLIFRNFSRSSSRTSGLMIESDPILPDKSKSCRISNINIHSVQIAGSIITQLSIFFKL